MLFLSFPFMLRVTHENINLENTYLCAISFLKNLNLYAIISIIAISGNDKIQNNVI